MSRTDHQRPAKRPEHADKAPKRAPRPRPKRERQRLAAEAATEAREDVPMSTSEPDEQITAAEAAALAGVDVETFRSYERRGYAPARVKMFGRTPVYSRRAVVAWLESRPGQGARTDRRKPAAESGD